MARTTDSSCSGPTEQFSPTADAPTACSVSTASVTVPPNSRWPSASMVSEHITGRSHTDFAASTKQAHSSMDSIVSATSRSTPARTTTSICSR